MSDTDGLWFLERTGKVLEADGDRRSVVFFDLETTGLGKQCEIVQMAAVSGGHSLNLYTVPRRRMERGASKVTGLRLRRDGLYRGGHRLRTNTLREVVVSFIAFLRMLSRPLVVGHNIRRFDCPLLLRALDELQLRAEFDSAVSGCVDTLPLAKEMLAGRPQHSFRQERLVRALVGVNYDSHNALEDVRALQTLFAALQPPPDLLSRHTFTLDTLCTTGHSALCRSGEEQQARLNPV